MTKHVGTPDDVYVQLVKSEFSAESMPFSIMIKTIQEYCPLVAGDNKLVESLKQRQFDVAIEAVVFVEVCMSVIPYKLSISFIQAGHGLIHII